MSKKRALLWGAIAGCIVGCALVLLGLWLDAVWRARGPANVSDLTPFLVIWYGVHWPARAVLDWGSSRFLLVAVIVGYWIIIGAAAGLLRWLLHDCKVRGYRRHAVLFICCGWILGTLALHCWVLHALTHMPSWASTKQESETHTMVLNSSLTGYTGTAEDRARARAAMQMQMPGRGVTVPSVEQKLAIALRMEENAQIYWERVAAMADNAKRRTARRAWVSWAATAFTPVILLVLFAVKTSRLARRPQPCASPNDGPAERVDNPAAGDGPPSVT